MSRNGAVLQAAILDLHVVADVDVLAQGSAGAEVAEGPDLHARGNLGFLHHRGGYPAPVADVGILDYRVWSNYTVLANNGLSLDHGIGEDGGVLADDDLSVDERRAWVGDGYAGEHPAFSDAFPLNALGNGQLDPVIHPEGVGGVQQRDAVDECTGVPQGGEGG